MQHVSGNACAGGGGKSSIGTSSGGVGGDLSNSAIGANNSPDIGDTELLSITVFKSHKLYFRLFFLYHTVIIICIKFEPNLKPLLSAKKLDCILMIILSEDIG